MPECEVCEFMVQSVADQVESFGKDKVVEVFERICGLMPEQEQQFVSQCHFILYRIGQYTLFLSQILHFCSLQVQN